MIYFFTINVPLFRYFLIDSTNAAFMFIWHNNVFLLLYVIVIFVLYGLINKTIKKRAKYKRFITFVASVTISQYLGPIDKREFL